MTVKATAVTTTLIETAASVDRVGDGTVSKDEKANLKTGGAYTKGLNKRTQCAVIIRPILTLCNITLE